MIAESPFPSLPEPKPQLLPVRVWDNPWSRAFLGNLYGMHLGQYGHEFGPSQEQLLMDIGALAGTAVAELNLEYGAFFKAAVQKTHVENLFTGGHIMFGTIKKQALAAPTERQQNSFVATTNGLMEARGMGYMLAEYNGQAPSPAP
jgi:hypothetical protein